MNLSSKIIQSLLRFCGKTPSHLKDPVYSNGEVIACDGYQLLRVRIKPKTNSFCAPIALNSAKLQKQWFSAIENNQDQVDIEALVKEGKVVKYPDPDQLVERLKAMSGDASEPVKVTINAEYLLQVASAILAATEEDEVPSVTIEITTPSSPVTFSSSSGAIAGFVMPLTSSGGGGNGKDVSPAPAPKAPVSA